MQMPSCSFLYAEFCVDSSPNYLISSSRWLHERSSVTILISSTQTLRLREWRGLGQGHPAGVWQSQDLNPVCLSASMALALLFYPCVNQKRRASQEGEKEKVTMWQSQLFKGWKFFVHLLTKWLVAGLTISRAAWALSCPARRLFPFPKNLQEGLPTLGCRGRWPSASLGFNPGSKRQQKQTAEGNSTWPAMMVCTASFSSVGYWFCLFK